jgi:hypothetical protein
LVGLNLNLSLKAIGEKILENALDSKSQGLRGKKRFGGDISN